MKRVLTPDNDDDTNDGADYTLHPDALGCWITYKGVSIHIFTPFGHPDVVEVEGFTAKEEFDVPLDSFAINTGD